MTASSLEVDRHAIYRPGIPRHVAIIMDGNGRWASRQGIPRRSGHRAGTDNIRNVLSCFAEHGVEYVTLFAFSTENWGRPEREVTGLLEILGEVIHGEVEKLHHQNVRIRHLGATSRLPKSLVRAIEHGLDLTDHNTGLTLCVAFDYGGRVEIVDAVKSLINSGVRAVDITEDLLASHFYLPDVPNPDLIIRTGGEQRLSNFLIWQAAYSELYYTNVYWPDFDVSQVKRALNAYRRRQRRFGRLMDAL
jgi:undecaprenyl diphosphate synthase